MVLHFVGFKGDEYNRAIKVWGQPDFIHRVYDGRAKAEFFDGDVVIFANGREDKFTVWSFDDSSIF